MAFIDNMIEEFTNREVDLTETMKSIERSIRELESRRFVAQGEMSQVKSTIRYIEHNKDGVKQ